MSGHGAYQTMLKGYVDSITAIAPKASEPRVITKLVEKAINSKKPKSRYVGGFMGKPIIFLHRLLSDKLFDVMVLSQFKPKNKI